MLKTIRIQNMSDEMKVFGEAAESLRMKKDSVLFTKADKSNNIVILDKCDYISSTEEFIQNGPYELVNYDPLPGMVRRTKDAVKSAADVFVNEEYFTLKLHVSNPIIPRLYTQLKLHKQGRKVRPITPNNDAATEKLAIWLLNKFNSLAISFETASIKNNIEFVNKIKDVEIADNEIQVSFDVESLFPNIPIDITLVILENWLNDNHVDRKEVNELVKLTGICMQENWFSI